ncbi:outer membrane beta-barrel protein [Niabella beijingensis]|uniref:outer membrane beta-barrel protein n=1 Tax=Niabella beijingensis TaxID=2872700 RepID=UPI001CBAB04D|nr:outer membrane beta-barrel protein [Niabella beijingensis]MBZ4190257.1 TonB-dependent receptor [Niabella beijingensis]
MKLLRRGLFIVIITVLAATAYPQDKKISITAFDQPLKSVLDAIQQRSGYNIIYSDEIVQDSIKVNIDVSQQPVGQILDSLLQPNGLFYANRDAGMIVIGSTELREQNRAARTRTRELKGRIVDADDRPVPYASIMLLEEDKNVSGTSGEKDGSFSVRYTFEEGMVYKLQASSIGYLPSVTTFQFSDTLQIPPLVLQNDKTAMRMVTVEAARPFVERRADRYIVNVEGSPLADGNNALEVLQKTPGIWVDPNGAIRINGTGTVTVMINDVTQRMSAADLAEYLRTIRSENIKKIEVIANPPAEYEASGTGGIIHIVLKKARDEGFTGQASVVYKPQKGKPYMSSGITAQYKIKKLYLFGNGFLSKEEQVYYARTINDYKDGSSYDGVTDRINRNRQSSYLAGLVYDISDKQSVSFQGGSTLVNLRRYFKTGIVLKDSAGIPVTGYSVTNWRRIPALTTATLNYSYKLDTLGSMFKLLADYVRGKKTEDMDVTSAYTDPLRDTVYRNQYPSSTEIYSGQADYVKQFSSRIKLQTGVKYVATRRDNTVTTEYPGDQGWTADPAASNQFIYDENLLMGYAAAERSVQRTSIKLGVRAEETYMKGNNVTSGQQFSRRYLNLFPSAFILQNLNRKSVPASLSFSYSRRIRRPQFGDLNPFRLRIGDYSVVVGNPDLLPEYSNNFKLGYNFWKGYMASLQYQRTSNIIAEFANPQENGVIEYQTRNFDHRVTYGASLYAPVKITKWWTANTYAGVFYTAYIINDFELAQTTLNLNTYQVFTLKSNIDFTLSAIYSSPYVAGNTKNASLFITDVSAGKKFFDNKLRVRVMLTDIFNTFREKSLTTFNGVRIDFYQKRPTRAVGISVNYILNAGKKIKDKKVEQSAEEEKNRI